MSVIKCKITRQIKSAKIVMGPLVGCDGKCPLKSVCPSTESDIGRSHTSYSYKGAEGNPIVIVFSCPNERCVMMNTPVQGGVFENVKAVFGKLLKRAIDKKIVRKDVERFDLCLRNVWVNNASCLKHPDQGERITEPSIQEVEANRVRLWNEIGNAKVIICFGDRAAMACDAALTYAALHRYDVKVLKVIKCCHLANQALRRIHSDSDELHIDRAELVASYIWEALRKPQRIFGLDDFLDFL